MGTAAKEFGRIDILVNNAGITKDGLAVRMKAADWEQVLRTNLTGAFLAIAAGTAGHDARTVGPHCKYLVCGG